MLSLFSARRRSIADGVSRDSLPDKKLCILTTSAPRLKPCSFCSEAWVGIYREFSCVANRVPTTGNGRRAFPFCVAARRRQCRCLKWQNASSIQLESQLHSTFEYQRKSTFLLKFSINIILETCSDFVGKRWKWCTLYAYITLLSPWQSVEINYTLNYSCSQ